MKWNRIFKALIFPHIAIMIILLPVSTVFLVYSMIYLEKESIIAIVSYVLAFYTLTIWCLKTPQLIVFFKRFKDNNKYAKKWLNDVDLRVKASLYIALIWNTAYGVFQLWLGFLYHTFWYYSLAGYYISLAVMRFFLVRYTSNKQSKSMKNELIRYRTCGIAFLIMNIALTLIIFFMVYWNRTFRHHQITTIAMAAYTFTTLTVAIINAIKYRKYNSPVYSATKAISLAAACVSMLTLESTMLTTFGKDLADTGFNRIMLATTGGAVSIFIISMAIYMIVQGTKKLKQLKGEN